MARLVLASVLAAAEAGTLAVTYKDCGAKHAQVTDLQPTLIHIGTAETLVGTGTCDEDVTSAHFTATVSALGSKLTECSGDGTKDIVCNLPLGVGKVTVKALTFPIAKGTVSIPVEVETSSAIPASLTNVDVHVAADDQNSESLICLDVHTQASSEEVEEVVEERVQGGGLAVTYEDCGAKHAQVTDLQPTLIHIGTAETLVGTGTCDEDVTSAHFTATVSALGSKLTECSGDGTKDIVCKLPMGVGKVTVKALTFPIAKGTVSIPVEVKTSSAIPASLANVDVHVAAEDQNSESLICLNVHTKATSQEVEEAFEEIVEEVKEAFEEIVQGSSLAVTYEDCGAKHAQVTDLQPTLIHIGTAETLVGTGTCDEDVTSAHFTATVSALGSKLTECSGDGTKDIVCNLPMGVGKVTVKALTFPIAKGTVSIPVEVKTSSAIPASLAHVDVHVAAEDQNSESLICLDVHTKAMNEVVV